MHFVGDAAFGSTKTAKQLASMGYNFTLSISSTEDPSLWNCFEFGVSVDDWRSFINSEGFIASVQGTTEETPDDDRRSEKMDETSRKKISKIIKISKKFFQIC